MRACVWVIATVAYTSVAHAEPTCEDTYVAAQRHRRDGELLAARRALVRCAQRDCPSTAQTDCAQWMREVEAALPTIVVRVQDPDGRDVQGAQLYIDGTQVGTSTEGRALELDPGAHELRVERPSYRTHSERITILHGEKDRRIELVLVPELPPQALLPAPEAAPAGPPIWIYLAGSAGLVGMGSFAYFGVTSTRDFDRAQAECAPHCTDDDTDRIRRKQIIADVSLGVGVAGLVSAVVGVLVYLYEDRSPDPIEGPLVRVVVNRGSVFGGTVPATVGVVWPWN